MKSVWNFNELRAHCNRLGIVDVETYIGAIQHQRGMAQFFAEQVESTWDNLFTKPFSINDESFGVAVFACDAYSQACVNAINSTAEMLLQLINQVVLNSKFAVDKVRFDDVIKELSKSNNHSRVHGELVGLYQLDTFRYLRSFWNVSKHHRLIAIDARFEFSEKHGMKRELRYKSFCYKKDVYDEKSGTDILTTYRAEVNERITRIGIEINEYLKLLP